jgi:type I restriction enzyme M protein
MALKKSELYSSLCQSCDELRGGMDGSQYKDYVLVLLFMKYVSDKAASVPGYLLDVPKGGSFADMVALKGDKEIGDKMNKIVAKLAEAHDLTIIKEADFNDDAKLGKGKEMVDRLTNLVAIFVPQAALRHRVRQSKGQFYTPAEVSRIMSQVVGVGAARDSKQTIYDPTCGSGSLLLKAHDEARHRTGHDLALYEHMPDWKTRRTLLNAQPFSHNTWVY